MMSDGLGGTSGDCGRDRDTVTLNLVVSRACWAQRLELPRITPQFSHGVPIVADHIPCRAIDALAIATNHLLRTLAPTLRLRPHSPFTRSRDPR